MPDNEKQKKKITLADLGVKTDVTPKQEEPIKEEEKKSSIVTPAMSGGLAKKDGKVVAADIEATHPVSKQQVPDNGLQEKYDLIDSALEKEKEKVKKEILDPLKEKCDTKKAEYELAIGRKLEPGEDPAYDKDGNPIDPNDVKEINKNLTPDSESDIDKELMSTDKMDNDDIIPVESEVRKTLSDNLSKPLDLSIQDDDIDDLLDDDIKPKKETTKESDEEEKQILKTYQDSVKKVINTDIPDVSNFKISSAPISVTKIFNKKVTKDPTETTATVPLLNSGRLITLSSLRGDEIVALDPETYGNNRLNQLRNIYSIIYKHDVSPTKPDTYVEWLKSICDFDTYQLYWGLYKATFKDSNFITYECPECKSIFMTPKPIDSMCRINPAASDDIKAKVKDLEEHGTDVVLESLLKPNIVPISKKYAFALKAPSIYANLFETSMLEQKYIDKYNQIISIIPYIDAMYYINEDNNSLIPISFETDRNNATKTVKHKIATLYKIIKDISTDEYDALSSHVLNISIHQKDAFQYITPATDCTGTYTKGTNKNKPCHHHFNEEIVDTPMQLLFIRRQLVVSANFITE